MTRKPRVILLNTPQHTALAIWLPHDLLKQGNPGHTGSDTRSGFPVLPDHCCAGRHLATLNEVCLLFRPIEGSLLWKNQFPCGRLLNLVWRRALSLPGGILEIAC